MHCMLSTSGIQYVLSARVAAARRPGALPAMATRPVQYCEFA
jgi:hypothetical protein